MRKLRWRIIWRRALCYFSTMVAVLAGLLLIAFGLGFLILTLRIWSIPVIAVIVLGASSLAVAIHEEG